MMRQRIAWLDAARVVACLMVVLLHGPLLYIAADAPCASLAAFLTVADGTNIFFIISGALLLPVTGSWRGFATRRVMRVLWPLLLWSVIYLAAGMARGELTLLDAVRLQPEAGHLWYLYMAIAVYATLPLVSRALAAVGDRGVAVYLVLWAASSLIPFWHGVLGGFAPMQHPLSIVHNCYGYVVLGWWLRRRPLPLFTRRHGWWLALLMLVAIVGVPLFEFTMQPALSWRDHVVAIIDNVGVNAVATSVLVFTVVQRLVPERLPEGRLSRGLRATGGCTFGIYLMHILVIDLVAAPLLHAWVYSRAVHPLLAGLAVSLTAFAVSLAACLALKAAARACRPLSPLLSALVP